MQDDRPERALAHARIMRQEPVLAEKRLWHALRDRRLQGVKFRRQHPVGRFIADCVCIAKNLIIEADGSQHGVSEYDMRRDAYLKPQGLQILRFSNHDIFRQTDSGLPW